MKHFHLRLRSAFSCAAIAFCFTPTPTSAQDGPYWETQALPSGGITSFTAYGSNFTYVTPTAVHFYSALLRRWHVQPISAQATVHSAYNDATIIQDGTTLHGLSTRLPSIVDSITVSPSTVLHPGPAASGWVSIAIDGTTAWGFAAFEGRWVSLQLSQPNPVVTLTSLVGLIQDGSQVHAMSAHHGTWESVTASTVVDINRELAMAATPNQLFGFSALKNTWTSTTLANADQATVTRGHTYDFATVGNALVAYSAYTGGFATHTLTGNFGGFFAGPNVALFDDGQVYGYSPANGLFTTLPGTSSLLQVAASSFGCMGLVEFAGGTLYGFSGLSGRFTQAPAGVTALSLGDCVVGAFDTNQNWYGYSAVIDAWVPGPQLAPTSDFTLYESLVLSHPGGFEAFSARLGRWVSLVRPGADSASLSIQGAMFLASTGTDADLFDPRLGRWVHFATNLNPTLSTWRLVSLVVDGNAATAYSIFHSQLDTVTIQGNVQVSRANSELAYVVTDTHVHIFTATGSLSTTMRFPEFSRQQARGGILRLIQLAAPQSAVTMIVGTQPTWLPLGSIGTLLIDPTSMIATFPMGLTNADGVLDVRLPLPGGPELNGVQLQVQNAVVPPAAAPFLSSSLSPILW